MKLCIKELFLFIFIWFSWVPTGGKKKKKKKTHLLEAYGEEQEIMTNNIFSKRGVSLKQNANHDLNQASPASDGAPS